MFNRFLRACILVPLLALVVAGCGLPGQDANQQPPAATSLSEADIAATVAAQVAATQAAQGAGAAPTSAPAATEASTASAALSEADVQATIAAAVAATQAAQAAPTTAAAPAGATAPAATTAPATGGATETLPTPQAPAPTAAPVQQPASASAQPPAMLLVLDASGSMLIDDGTGRPKIDAAKEALNTLVNALPDGAPVGLRVYGATVPNTDKVNGCRDTQLVAPIAPLNKSALQQAINSFQAVGFTPIAYALEQGFNDLPPEGARTLVLVSDGEETCDRDPCQVARDLKARGADFVVEPVGFQVDDATRAQLQCIAQATGGTYRDAANAADLAARLQEISQRALREYQTAGGEIVGGTSFNDAVTIQAAQYVERLRIPEAAYYKLNVPQGRRVRITATLIPPQWSEDPVGNPDLTLTVYDPNRQELGEDTVALDLFSEPNGTGTAGLESEEPSAGGDYFVSLALNSINGNDVVLEAEFMVELVVEIF
jgi:hypothetical protein